MLVRVNIVGGGANEPVDYPDGANTKAVKEDLLGGYGKGILKQQGIGILSDTLASGDYEYHLTAQQGRVFQFMVLSIIFLPFLMIPHCNFILMRFCSFVLCRCWS